MMLKTLTFCSLLAMCVAKYEITTISEFTTSLGGAPFWDAEQQSFFVSDAFALKYNLLRYDFEEKKLYRANIPNWVPLKVVEMFVPCEETEKENKTFIIGDRTKTAKKIRWDGKSETAEMIDPDVFSVEQEFSKSLNLFHIGKPDQSGRLYFGTMRGLFCNNFPTPNASLYKYTKDEGVVPIFENVKVTGGMDWWNDTFFTLDCCENTIYAFDCDPVTGDISNRREVFKTHEDGNKAPHHPVNIAIDRDGKLYASMFNDSSIWIIDPILKKRIDKIELPTELVTNVAFGGPDLDHLLVTTAGVPLNANTGLVDVFRKLTPQAGSMFLVRLNGTRGYAGNRWAGK